MSESRKPTISITRPSLYGPAALGIVMAYGLFLAIPVLFAAVAMSLSPLGVLPILLPVIALCATAFFLPFGFGNPHLRRLFRARRPDAATQEAFLVQLTLHPRLRSGLRSVLDDADDFGWLYATDSQLVYEGDSVQLRLPLESVTQTARKNIGFRGAFLYGPKLVVEVPALAESPRLEFGDRSSVLLPDSWRNARKLYAMVRSGVSAARSAHP